MALGQLTETLPTLPVSQDSLAIKSQRLTPDMLAFQFGAAQVRRATSRRCRFSVYCLQVSDFIDLPGGAI